MTNLTRNYRLNELDKVAPFEGKYKPKLKIITTTGETNWLDVTERELNQIKNILLKEE
jgi:hypothetical protein